MLPEAGAVHFDVDTQSLNAAGSAFISHLAWLCATILLGLVIILIIGRFITPKFAAWSKLVLTGHEQVGYISGESTKELPPPGTKGYALATLRPAGKVMINDVVYDAITAGNFIEKGSPIVVSRIEGSVIVVDIDRDENK
jgi:membrane-bound serine protease (ClpP class)